MKNLLHTHQGFTLASLGIPVAFDAGARGLQMCVIGWHPVRIFHALPHTLKAFAPVEPAA